MAQETEFDASRQLRCGRIELHVSATRDGTLVKQRLLVRVDFSWVGKGTGESHSMSFHVQVNMCGSGLKVGYEFIFYPSYFFCPNILSDRKSTPVVVKP